MFTNYENIPDTYTPNNLCLYKCKPESYTKLNQVEFSKPYELYNAKNELEGYFWYYGDSIVLDFSITGEVVLDDGTTNGQYIDASDFLNDKTYSIRLYDFRMNEVYSASGNSSKNIVLNIDKESSKKFVRGIYYLSLTITGTEFNETIFSPQDCKLLVK